MLRVSNLSLPNGKKISWEINGGQILYLKAPNGSGKSLLLKSLSGLVKCDYDLFEFKNIDYKNWSYQQFRSKVLYQGPSSYFGNETVEEFLKLPSKLEIYKNLQFSLSLELKNYLDQWGISGQKVGLLSSGQKQIVTLFRLLQLRPEILLLDEVMSHLDHEKTQIIESVLDRWIKENNLTVIIVTHDNSQIARLPGKIVNFEELNS